MLSLRDPVMTSNIADPEIRDLVEQRLEDICAGDDYEEDIHGYMIVVEAGDRVEVLEEESGCPILHSLSGNARYGDADLKPCFECLEEHPACYEMVFVPSGGDFGIVIFIPKQEGINSDLLAMCAEYAEPAP